MVVLGGGGGDSYERGTSVNSQHFDQVNAPEIGEERSGWMPLTATPGTPDDLKRHICLEKSLYGL